MSMKDRAKSMAQSSLEKVEKATGKALGDENMPAKDQVGELKDHLKHAGDKVIKATGKALGDENMPAKDQVGELKDHLKHAGDKVRRALKKDE